MSNIDLSKVESLWENAQLPESSKGLDEPVPDGPYQVHVERVEWKQSAKGNTYLNWSLEIDAGPYEGRWIFKTNMAITQSNMSYLKKDLAICGAKPEKISEFPLEKLLDTGLRVTKKTKGDNTEVYFNACHATPRAIRQENGKTDAKQFDDEDIPF